MNELRNIIMKDYSNTLGLVVYHSGEKTDEEYFGDFRAEHSAHIFSATKSVVSLLFGIAQDRGLLSLEDKIPEFFPEYTPKRCQPQFSEVTIEHLMTMSAPFRFKYDPWKKVCTSSDWGLTALEQIGGKSSAGERFHYTTIGIQILSDIFQRATSESLNAFAERELFSPLGIAPVPDAPITDKESQMRFSKTTEMRGWACDPSGHYTTGWGLSLTAEDMAKIGLLVLNKGSFGGRQLVSQSYIDRMTSCRQKNYGYLWWVYPKNEPLTIMRKTYSGSKADIFCAQGVGGTLTAVIPEADTVISMICSMKYFPRPRFELIDRIISRYI